MNSTLAKSLIVTGSYPPDICGVGDYTSCFMNAADNDKWDLYYSKDWKLGELRNKLKEINSKNYKRIYMQYPTQGYGWSLLPQLLCLYYSWFTKIKFVVVLHELSQRTLKAKLASFVLLFANHVVFTNDFERNYAAHWFPFFKKRYSTIRILSNIDSVKQLNKWEDRKYDIAYFGHIRPLKGLEDFFESVQQITQKKKIKIAIIGQVLPEYETYINKLTKEYESLSIDYKFNNSTKLVSELLNNTKVVFLPFPDGISERRGSFLAAIANGALVMTYNGMFVTPYLKKICFFTSLKNASKDLVSLLDTISDADYKLKRDAMKEYLSKELPGSWKNIVQLYEQIC